MATFTNQSASQPASQPASAAAPESESADESVRAALCAFVEERTRSAVPGDLDLFASGLVSSMFAMQLVVYLETTFGVTVDGPDLTLDNFRTVDAMTALVERLRGCTDG